MTHHEATGDALVSSTEKVVNAIVLGGIYDKPDNLFEPEITPPRGSQPKLSEATLAGLRSAFDASDHHPSDQMWQALTALATTLEDMVEGRCKPKVYLSSLDPGVGKTQSVVHFVRALIASEAHQEIGVLLCLSRLQEISALVPEMALAETDYAVLTGDADLNKRGLGIERANEARVLFTTQQMIERRGDGKRFALMSDFHFRGRPRVARIWDESYLPGRAISLNRDAIAALLQPIRALNPGLANEIQATYDGIGRVGVDGLYEVPDFQSMFGLDLNGALRILSRAPRREVTINHQSALTALWMLGGKTPAVRHDDRYGTEVLDYHENLPEGLEPVVVLDASGRVRETYRQWEKKRNGLELLRPTAPKRYDNLTIHCWRTGGGKSAFRENGRVLLEGIVAAINNDKPDTEKWLIVYHRDGINMDLPAEVQKRITGDPERVHFVNWGNAHASNEYRDIPNVILAGTLFYRPSYYEALARLVVNQRPSEGPIDRDLQLEVTRGEHRHLVLQALCRGSVRKCRGDVCAPCDAYIIASPRSGIPAALRTAIFPGCTVVPWNDPEKEKVPLSGKAKEAVAFILDWFTKTPDGLLRFGVVQKELGIKSAANFRRDVRFNPAFREALDEHDIQEAQELGDNRRGWLKL